MRVSRFIACAVMGVVPLLIEGCAGFGVHRIDIQQGNLVTQDQLAKVKLGMSRLDVRNALGTPLLQDVFNGNRWDYYFTLEQSTKYGPFGRDRQRFEVAILFENDKVAKINGEASAIEILTGGGEKRQLPNTLPPGAPPPQPKQ
jgi:outer membrane protein assembly factor BamE